MSHQGCLFSSGSLFRNILRLCIVVGILHMFRSGSFSSGMHPNLPSLVFLRAENSLNFPLCLPCPFHWPSLRPATESACRGINGQGSLLGNGLLRTGFYKVHKACALLLREWFSCSPPCLTVLTSNSNQSKNGRLRVSSLLRPQKWGQVMLRSLQKDYHSRAPGSHHWPPRTILASGLSARTVEFLWAVLLWAVKGNSFQFWDLGVTSHHFKHIKALNDKRVESLSFIKFV